MKQLALILIVFSFAQSLMFLPEIDQLRSKLKELEGQYSIDDRLEVISLDTLAEKYGITLISLRKKLIEAGGEVFKLGRHSVIRKIKLLAVFETLECKKKQPLNMLSRHKN